MNLELLQKRIEEIQKEISAAQNHIRFANEQLIKLESAIFEARLNPDEEVDF